MILLVDSYDSFSYNLYQLLGMISPDIRVVRNDELTVDEIRDLTPSAIVLSPGPGRPSEAGILEDIVRELGAEIPILGVCLGHQAICEAYGGRITYAKKLMHGKQSEVWFDPRCPVFRDVPTRARVARYHSLAADPESLPECLTTTAMTTDHEIMAVAHKEYPVYGLQFHPESILTEDGQTILRNFLEGAALG